MRALTKELKESPCPYANKAAIDLNANATKPHLITSKWTINNK